MSASCDACATHVDQRPATWSLQVSPRGEVWFCERCTRDRLASIEGRMDDATW
jgi:hypothetical protein